MELSKEFHGLVSKIVIQKKDELWREQCQRQDEIMKDSSSKGWVTPPGSVYRELNALQEDSIRRRGDIVWSALEQTLEAFDPPFSPDLAAQLYSLAESFFPLSLCEPQDYRRMRWEHPFADTVNLRKRSQLETVLLPYRLKTAHFG